jgi:hypothetical protein
MAKRQKQATAQEQQQGDLKSIDPTKQASQFERHSQSGKFSLPGNG